MKARNPRFILISILLAIPTLACIIGGGQGDGSDQHAPLETVVSHLATQNGQLAMQHNEQQARLSLLETQAAQQSTMIPYLFTRVPGGINPGGTLTPTPYRPVTGSVLIDRGKCCIGGIAGETIHIPVSFTATSPLAEVTEMRYHSGITKYTEADLKFTPWVPFQAELAIPWPVVINWVGMWVTVQYRDAQGNLSLVYSDDISVEGMPAPSTGTP